MDIAVSALTSAISKSYEAGSRADRHHRLSWCVPPANEAQSREAKLFVKVGEQVAQGPPGGIGVRRGVDKEQNTLEKAKSQSLARRGCRQRM
jgi:hypothetical protein